MEYSGEVKKLAETLKNSGLAASMADALQKAQSMIGDNELKEEELKVKEEPFEMEKDSAQTTLHSTEHPDEKKEIKESPEPEGELKEEEVFRNDSDTEKNKGLSNGRKTDLNDVFNVKE